MKKITTFVLATCLSSSLLAHDLWVWGENNSDKFGADLIYGHDFPNPEKIADERTVLFDNVKVISNEGEQILSQAGENYHFEGKSLKDGVYIINAYYKPTPWIQKSDGSWDMNKTRKDTNDAVKYCGVSTIQSKALIKLGDSKDSKIITKPLKRGLEFLPLFDSIDEIKEGNLIKFKLMLNGNSVKNASVYASYGGYATNDMAQAGYAKTDLDGNFEFRPLKKGLWYLKATVNTNSNNKDCEINNDKATIVFEVK